MDTRTRFVVIASTALLCLGALFSPASSAGDGKVSIRYAGSGWDTGIQGFLEKVSLTTTSAQGTFGDSTLTITTEWTANPGVQCPAGFVGKFSLVYSAAVSTFPDGSQLFGVSQSGWICATAQGVYFGEVTGNYVNGTGRFKGATGTYVSKFDGAYLEPHLNFRSVEGTVEGMLDPR